MNVSEIWPFVDGVIAGVIGGAIGLIGAVIIHGWMSGDTNNAADWLLGRRWFSQDGKLGWKARQFFPLRRSKTALAICCLGLNPMGLAVFANGPLKILLILYFVLLGFALSLGLLMFMSSTGRRLRMELLRQIVSKAVRMQNLQLAFDLMQELMASKDADLRTLAAQYLRFVPADWAVAALETLVKSDHLHVYEAAYQSLELRYTLPARAEEGKGMLGLEALLIRYRRTWRKLEVDAVESVLMGDLSKPEIEWAIDTHLAPQIPIKQAFPHTYCVRCNCRPAIKASHGWWWLHCPICAEDDDIQPGIQQVYGQIGGAPTPSLIDGVYRIPLWDATPKTLTAAQIDRLEILDGEGAALAWAISKVVQMVEQNFPTCLGKIEVYIADGVVVDENSLRLLAHLQPG